MKKYKVLIAILMIIMLCGCNKSPIETDKDTYWIDTKALESKDRKLSKEDYSESMMYDEFNSEFSRYAYQFMPNGKCKRITLGGSRYFKDNKITELYPKESLEYGMTSDYNEIYILSTKGIWTSDSVNCNYEIKDDEITVKVASCDTSTTQETIKGKYKLGDDNLKISWNKIEYRNGKLNCPTGCANGNLDIIWDKKPYDKSDLENDEIEYTNSKIINDIEEITYKHEIEPYMFYEVEEIEYNISDAISNGEVSDNITLGFWSQIVLQENNSNMSVDDFIFVNGNGIRINKTNYVKNGSTFLGTYNYDFDDKITLYIPYKKYSNDEFIENIAKIYGADKNDVKVFACYSTDEGNNRMCLSYNNPLNKETSNYMDAIEYNSLWYSSAGFYTVKLDSKKINKYIKESNKKTDSLWKTYEIDNSYNECLYGENK